MFIKKISNAFLAGLFFLMPVAFLANETEKQDVTLWDRVRDEGLAGIAAVGAVLKSVSSYNTLQSEFQFARDSRKSCPISSTIDEVLDGNYVSDVSVGSGLGALAILLGAKAISNTTWKNILMHKKAALAKYSIAGSISCFLGLNAFNCETVFIGGCFLIPSVPWPPMYHVGLRASSLFFGFFAVKYLKEVCDSTPKTADV